MGETPQTPEERAVQALVAARIVLASAAWSSRPIEPDEVLPLVDEALGLLQSLSTSQEAYGRLGTFLEASEHPEPDDAQD